MANVIYGSLATAVITLLYLEIASIILLVGAQILAELQASAAAGLPWSERPPGRDGTDARGFLPPGPER